MGRNPHNDPIPEYENLGSAGTPHSDERDRHRIPPTEDGDDLGSPNHCEICDYPIAPRQDRCAEHRCEYPNWTYDPDAKQTRTTFTEWRLSHIAVVVVPATTYRHAMATTHAALKNRHQVPGTGDSYELIEDFEDLSTTFLKMWGEDLHDAAPLDSDDGQALLDQAREKIHQETHPSRNQGFIYTQHGTAITDPDWVDELIEDAEDEEYWVVPAVIYQRHRKTIEEDGPDISMGPGFEELERNEFEDVMQRLEEEGKLEDPSTS